MGAVVVAQLAEQSLLIPEDLISNPVIGNFYGTFIYCKLCVEKTKIKKKRAFQVSFSLLSFRPVESI